MSRPHYLFVTGKLAEPALRRVVNAVSATAGFDFTIAALPISVVSLATTSWIARHLQMCEGATKLVIPGLCLGDLSELTSRVAVAVERGPKDMRDLPEYFGNPRTSSVNYGAYNIEILAEINHAPRLERRQIMEEARKLRNAGADVIDLGCDPGSTWNGIGDTVRALRDEGIRVSIDSFDAREVKEAVAAGAELVLSVNGTNCEQAADWGCEVVAIPDVPATLEGLERTVTNLSAARVPYRVDPVIEPIGFGFAASLGRYLDLRRRCPDVPMLMGVGNLTELTDVDSAGINVLLLGVCQELGIRSVLTTQVINWCRSSVKELDIARRLVYHAYRHHVLPKHVAPELVMLRDPKLREHGPEAIEELANRITDPNFRLIAERGLIHVINNQMHLQDDDPFELFRQMQKQESIDSSHSFYLGYELAKAELALLLGKNYMQDQPLTWGFLSASERNRHATMTEVEQANPNDCRPHGLH
jgi:dihydropteroate synthase-like protein